METASEEASINEECPRCGVQSDMRYYGPCPSCYEELRSSMMAEVTPVQASDYEPKMNVTPNAVASKE